MVKLFNYWVESGWASVGASILFGIYSILNFINESEWKIYSYIAIGLLIIGIIQLILKNKLK